MKILFSSDFHGMEYAYRRFAYHLKNYDMGIISGDMQEDFLVDEEIERLTGTSPKYLEKLAEGYDGLRDSWMNSKSYELMVRALDMRAIELSNILDSARKPIFIVLGNHDQAIWNDTEFIHNIHMKRVEFQDYNLVGYRWTRLDRPHEFAELDMETLSPLIDSRTILITHSPPYGFLDGVEHYGFTWLRRLPTPYLHLFGHVHNKPGQQFHRINGSWPEQRKFFEIDVERRFHKLI